MRRTVPTPARTVPTPARTVPTPARTVPTPARTVPTPVRTVRWAAALGVATLLASCAGTVQGTAAVGTALTLAGATDTASTAPTTTSARTPARSSTDPTASPTSADVATDTTDDGGYTGLALGDPVVIWDDDGEADVYVRGAQFTGADEPLKVTVDYECWDGECPFYVSDWTVSDDTGRQYRPVVPSGFGDHEDQIGVLEVAAQKRGYLYFDVPAGPVTVEFDAASGDPATWLVPAA